MNTKKLNPKVIIGSLKNRLQKIQPYSFIAFMIFVAILYGFLVLRINNLKGAEPSESAVTSQVQAAKVPHIDEAVVNQLESLQDNSVSVQALFDQARKNPFQ